MRHHLCTHHRCSDGTVPVRDGEALARCPECAALQRGETYGREAEHAANRAESRRLSEDLTAAITLLGSVRQIHGGFPPELEARYAALAAVKP